MEQSASESAPPDEEVIEACARLMANLDGLVRHVCDLLVEQEPTYSVAVESHELETMARSNVAALVESVRTGRAKSTPAPSMTGRRRAEQGVPLATVLSGYRLGVMQVWNALVDQCGEIDRENADATGRASRALLGATASLWTTYDLHTHQLSDQYRAFEAERLRENSLRRQVLISAIFQGHGVDDHSLTEVARLLGLPRTGRFVVLETSARTGGGDPGAVQGEVWLRGGATDRCLVTLTGPDDLARVLRRMDRSGRGPVGVSSEFTDVSHIPTGVWQAHVALRGGPEQGATVTRFADVPVAGIVLAAPAESASLAERVLGDLCTGHSHEAQTVVQTLRAWFQHEGSAERTAGALHCHPNTVRYRLGKLTAATGLSLKDPLDTALLYIALEADRLINTPGTSPARRGRTGSGLDPAASPGRR